LIGSASRQIISSKLSLPRPGSYGDRKARRKKSRCVASASIASAAAYKTLSAFSERRVRAERFHHDRFWIDPNTRLRCGYGIAVVGVGKERGFGEELAPMRCIEDHQMVIDSAADQAKPTAFTL
jgi:hypothetical protein